MDPSERARYAERALRAYAAMQRAFRRPSGLYRRDGRPGRLGVAAHLWPAARAFVATLDLAGIDPELRTGLDAGRRTGFDGERAIAGELAALARYWDPTPAPAYASDLHRTPLGGDRYYDDNAWVGLALIQLERMRPGSGWLERAQELWRFALTGWDPLQGGVFWVEQGHGIGRRNHDRNTVSTAPNAALALHLAELGRVLVPAAPVGPDELYRWVLANLGDGAGLFHDKLRGDGTLDRTIWSYNQGNMVGASVLMARAPGEPSAEHLARAETIARATLGRYAAGGFDGQPPAFDAICFRNLLQLHAVSGEDRLRVAIEAAVRAYADAAWERWRDGEDRFTLGPDGTSLLTQSALVQILALLAWDPAAYGTLA
ncbi:MAG TPA: glycoside hydrolase family 76 protein [Solirubrobacteraceae bacterium]|nr:glycoside hydrolase family 76 protein [Solirubrobacteraceae bacterium]